VSKITYFDLASHIVGICSNY